MRRDGSCPIELVWETKESCLSENLYLKCQLSILMVPAQSSPMVGLMGHDDGAGLDLMSAGGQEGAWSWDWQLIKWQGKGRAHPRVKGCCYQQNKVLNKLGRWPQQCPQSSG